MNARKFFGPAIAAVTLALTLSACSTGTLPGQTGSAATSTTLKLALRSDISTPDPDTAYSGSEMNVVMAAYEGLVKYATGVDKAEIVPSLADSWTVSPDGLTYTFELHQGVTFHDGTSFTSAAVEPSFKRRAEIGARGPGYMVAGVASVKTPSDSEVVITLKAPNSAFLDYLASPFGPKMVSPVALKEHAGKAGKDFFATHDAGTGPFEYADFQPGVSYGLKAYDGYWGTKAGYQNVTFTVRDSLTTIQLQLESGELDGMIVSGEKNFYAAAKANPQLKTALYPSMIAPELYLNPRTKAFTDQADRLKFLSGIDFTTLVNSAFGELATPQTGIFPTRIIDPALNKGVVTYDATALNGLATGAFKGQKLSIAYPSSVPGAQSLADNLAATLNTAGIETTSTGLESGVYWSTVYDPAKAPDITLFSGLPDAGHPDTWARIYYTPSGGLNMMGVKVPGVEELLDKAVQTGDNSIYAEASTKISESGYWYTMASMSATGVFGSSVTGFETASYPVLGFTIDLSKLAPAK